MCTNMRNQKLIDENIELVYYIVHKHYPTFVDDEDIIQCGMLGLCKAANTWDENKSTFSTYAGKCIRNEINYEFRNRKKHQGVLSLDYEYSNDSDEDITLKDTVVGQDDVDYVDATFVYQNLNPLECEIVDCKRKGMTTIEIANQLGCSKKTVATKIRKIKSKIE